MISYPELFLTKIIPPPYRYTPLPNDHFENFLIRCISSNCPRPLRAIKHIAHALIYVLNSPKLEKPKLEQAKPAPKYKQPKMSDFCKKI